MTTNPNCTFTPRRLRLISGVFLAAATAVGLARIAVAVAMDGTHGVEVRCEPILILLEEFDGVMPPALPTSWSSMTWATSNSGVPTPPAETPPNAVFVDDPDTVSDKQLLSPNIGFVADAGPPQLRFRNNFNLQDGFDGGVLEISFDDGLTFQDIVDAGGTFLGGGYNGTISSCCGNPLAGRQAWTGTSSGFIDTTVNLPHQGAYILRWRMGSDSSVSGEGWRIDNVAITQCYTPRGGRGRPTPHPRPTLPR
jgi:hypothetical protein